MSATPPDPPSAISQLRQQFKTPRAAAVESAYPPIRNFVLDVMAEGRRKNIINLVFQADITGMLARLDAAQDDASITSVVSHALAQVVERNKDFNAYRLGKSRMVRFEDVDLSFTVEREVDGVLLPVPYILRAANRKSIEEIHRELQAAKVAAIGAGGPMSALEKTFFLMPHLLRRMVWHFIRRDPHKFKQLVGTVGVTSMGMFASGAAVVQPITPMTLTLSIGAIEKKVVMQDGVPAERAFIHLNLGADHDIIDGAPLMRFAEAFGKELQAGELDG
ncbi:MAG: 2-oxo acid dehydrogenase subunit E2 [Betaproteobacteria bacterium]